MLAAYAEGWEAEEQRSGLSTRESKSPWASGRYRHTQELLALDVCRPLQREKIPGVLEGRASPLDVHEWRSALATVPDRNFADYIVTGIEKGFRVGFQYANHLAQSARQNMPSAEACAQPVEQFLEGEAAASQVAGPLEGTIPWNHGEQDWGSPQVPARQVARDCGPVIPTWRQRERWHQSEILLHEVCDH